MPTTNEEVDLDFDRYGIPHYMRDGLTRWIKQRILPGEFLQAVLRNDLFSACARADDQNKLLLSKYVIFLFNQAPSASWGSPEKVERWASSCAGQAE